MTRGDVVIAGERGSFAGKPRPWVIVQNPIFCHVPSSVTVCAISGSAEEAVFRVGVLPSKANGLQQRSVVQVDKLLTLRTSSIQEVTGSLDASSMIRIDEALRLWLDL